MYVFPMCEEFLAVQLDLPMQSAHGGEFSLQVSGSAGHWLLQRSGGIALGVCSFSAALERSGVFAGCRTSPGRSLSHKTSCANRCPDAEPTMTIK